MFPVAWCADKFGRRITIQVGAAIYMCDMVDRWIGPFLMIILCSIGGALQTGAQNMDMMLAGRFFAGEDYYMCYSMTCAHPRTLGFGTGILADLAPLYQVRELRWTPSGSPAADDLHIG